MPDLTSISARDIMSSHLLTVCESWSIQTLIDFFNDKKISGAPVLSKNGDIIGVVSLSDIINFDVNRVASFNRVNMVIMDSNDKVSVLSYFAKGASDKSCYIVKSPYFEPGNYKVAFNSGSIKYHDGTWNTETVILDFTID